jgi:nicotinamidase-related amidase
VPVDLNEMFAPSQTAVLTMEVQRNIVGDLSSLPALREAVEEAGALAGIHDLLAAARGAGVPIVHCTVGPPIVPGAAPNYPGAAAIAKRRAASGTSEGPEAAELVPEIGAELTDLVVQRHHGISPFTGTELDAVLRRLGTRTVVACGVSLNVGIIGLSLEAVSLGYRVAVAIDAVAGVPVDYGKAVLENTFPFIATRVSVQDLRSVWGNASR